MKALVTGATGFVGSHLVEALQRQQVEVTALARSREKAALLSARGVHVVEADLHDLEGLTRAAQGQAIVYHVAGLVAARSEADFLHANRDGARNVLAAAERSGTEAARPVTAYGRSKLAAETLVRDSTLPWSIVRPPIVYGPRDREVLKIFRMARFGVAPVFGDGSQELSAIHAADLANALMAVAEHPSTAGHVYNACHPEIFSSRDFGLAVGQAMHRSVITIPVPAPLGRALLSVTETTAKLAGQTTILTTDKAHEFFQPAWTGDPRPLTRDTGWRASFDLQTGLADTYQWYRRAGWL